jgi:hypothetical protein
VANIVDEKLYKKIEKAKDKLTVSKDRLGKAGEYLVAGKLLLNGFNVYSGAVDDGIDLVARKSRKFYFIQVKTCQDVGYDSGKFMASINISSFSKYPPRQTFLVLVLHYLGPTSSPDFMGDHNVYEQLFIVLPAEKIFDFFKKKNGKVVFSIQISFVGEHSANEGWIAKLRYGKKDLVLDEFLINSFWQIEV